MAEKRTKASENSLSVRKTANNAVKAKKSSEVRKKSSSGVVKSATGRPVRTSEMHAVREVRVINMKKKDKKPFPWAVIFTAIILTAMFLFMMMNYAEVDKYRSEIASLDSKIATMQKTQDNLEVTLSNKYNLSDIKDYAENELGMVTKDKLTSHRITIEQDDRVEMHTYDDGEEGGGGFLLAGFGEVLRDFFSNNEK